MLGEGGAWGSDGRVREVVQSKYFCGHRHSHNRSQPGSGTTWQVIAGRAGVPNRKPLGDLEAGGLEPRLERGGLAALSQVQDQTRLALLFVNPSRQGGPSGGPQRV